MNWSKLLSSKRLGDKPGTTFSESRSRFDQDYDRVIFSYPFRKLQDKTQVFPLPEDDFVHTRLTHSLEVSSVGRSLGKEVATYLLKEYPELAISELSIHDIGGIVAAACLAHDLGNPPFGHSGETAISSFFVDHEEGRAFRDRVSEKEWKDLISFEGNAQGFRILNNVENGSLRLTYATLGAFTKYPRSSSSPSVSNRKSQKKYGYYQSNREQFSGMAEEMGLLELSEGAWCRHPLAFLVEAADDICYNIIDLEDGCRLGLVSFEETKNLLTDIIQENYSEKKLVKIKDPNDQLGLLRALAINRLIRECVETFIREEKRILDGEFDRALTDSIPTAPALKAISELSIHKIYRSRQVLEREAGGFEVIGKLMDAFCLSTYHTIFASSASPKQRSIYRLLPDATKKSLEERPVAVYEMLLLIMDFISSLTDSYAIKLYRIIYGYSLPAGKA